MVYLNCRYCLEIMILSQTPNLDHHARPSRFPIFAISLHCVVGSRNTMVVLQERHSNSVRPASEIACVTYFLRARKVGGPRVLKWLMAPPQNKLSERVRLKSVCQATLPCPVNNYKQRRKTAKNIRKWLAAICSHLQFACHTSQWCVFERCIIYTVPLCYTENRWVYVENFLRKLALRNSHSFQFDWHLQLC